MFFSGTLRCIASCEPFVYSAGASILLPSAGGEVFAAYPERPVQPHVHVAAERREQGQLVSTLSVNKQRPVSLSALTAARVFSRWAGFPAGRPSSLPSVSAWTSPEAPLVSLRRCSSPPQTRGTGCSSAAPLSSPCSVPQPRHTQSDRASCLSAFRELFCIL